MSFNIYRYIRNNNEKELLRILINTPPSIIHSQRVTERIIEVLLEVGNIHFLNIFIIYGLNFEYFKVVIDLNHYEYIDEIAHYTYKDDLIYVLDNNVPRSFNPDEEILPMNINQIYFALWNDIDYLYIVKLFINYNIIPVEKYNRQCKLSGKQHYAKYDMLRNYICRVSDEIMNDPVFYYNGYYERDDLLSGRITEFNGVINEHHLFMDEEEKNYIERFKVEDDKLDFDFNTVGVKCITFNERMEILSLFLRNIWRPKLHRFYLKHFPKEYSLTLDVLMLIMNRFKNQNQNNLPFELWEKIITIYMNVNLFL